MRGRSSWQLPGPPLTPLTRRAPRDGLERCASGSAARQVQENCRRRPARRDHGQPPVLTPSSIVEIYERTEPAGVDKADRAQVHHDRHRRSVSPRQRVPKLADPREVELALRSNDNRFGQNAPRLLAQSLSTRSEPKRTTSPACVTGQGGRTSRSRGVSSRSTAARHSGSKRIGLCPRAGSALLPC
jgi:hypothetical protein